MKRSIQALSEGGLMCAIGAIVLLINRQSGGWLEVFFSWIMTLPFLVYTVRHGLRNAMIAAVSMCFLSLLLAAPTTIFYVISAQVCALLYGSGILYHWSKKKTLWLMGICLFLSYVITAVLFAELFGYDPYEDIKMTQWVLRQFTIATLTPAEFVWSFALLFACFTTWAQTISIHIFAVLCLTRLHLPSFSLESLHPYTFHKQDAWLCLMISFFFFYGNMVKLDGIFMILILSCYLSMCIIVCIQCIRNCILQVRNKKIALAITFILPLLCFFTFTRNALLGIVILSGLLHKKGKEV